MSYQNQPITFTYKHCYKEDFNKEASFDESLFEQKLKDCFEMNIQIDRIDVVFELDEAKETNQFECTINVFGPKTHFHANSEGSDYARVARDAIDVTISKLRKEKDKLTHS